MAAMDSDEDSSLSGPELPFMETMWDEIDPESSDGDINWGEVDSWVSGGT
jgi:hypothetical protein